MLPASVNDPRRVSVKKKLVQFIQEILPIGLVMRREYLNHSVFSFWAELTNYIKFQSNYNLSLDQTSIIVSVSSKFNQTFTSSQLHNHKTVWVLYKKINRDQNYH